MDELYYQLKQLERRVSNLNKMLITKGETELLTHEIHKGEIE